MSLNVTVGIPRGLMYHSHGKQWEKFFRELGCDIMVSPETNKSIVEDGIKRCSNEICLPVKVFHGHVFWLMGRSDFVFIPRYYSLEDNGFSCPNFCGLPDMVFLNILNKPKILIVDIHAKMGLNKTLKSLIEIAEKLNIPFSIVERKFKNVFGGNFEEFKESRMTEHLMTDQVKQKLMNLNTSKVAVLGHPYMVLDRYMSMNILEKLKSRGVQVTTPANLDYIEKRRMIDSFDDKDFWSSGLDSLGSSNVFLSDPSVTGIIYITPFGCGMDSLVIEFLERKLTRQNRINYLKLTIDEHTGEAGFETRVEAFLDMIGVNGHESHLPAYGQHLYSR